MMKKLLMITMLLISGLYSANAQKGKKTDVVVNPNVPASRALPDLTFDLVPVVVTGGSGVEKVQGTKTSIKMGINFIVKDIGMLNAKPSMVYAEYSFMGTQRVGNDIRETMIHRQSEQVPISAIAMGKDELVKQIFIFRNTPENAYGKEIKLRLVIVPTGVSSQNELSKTNNSSAEIMLTLEP
ncbi:hypothetical protein [Pedobacter sp.]|jgi:hypothetical protein|uniref:hypothetical protein n=1 Tax=Pedobacter sp. TaxID=1411316 RepID=UPI003566F1E9